MQRESSSTWFHQALRRRRSASEAAGGEAGVGEGGQEVEGTAELDAPHGEKRLRRSTLELLDNENKMFHQLTTTLYIFNVRRREEKI